MKRLLLIMFSLYFVLGHQFISVAFANKKRWDGDMSQWSLMEIYSYNNDTLKIDSLLKKGVKINDLKTAGTVLEVAVRKGNLLTVSFLLKHGANPNLPKPDGSSPLMFACFGNDFDIVKLLLDYNANPNKTLKNGYTPLMATISFGTIKIMRLLIDKGAKVNAKKADGTTALYLAEQTGNTEKAIYLKQRGAK